eukprot:snap_masked-scaffold_69-processed-gene-0.25-mRNA-1 protein AED:1.00 eAED:1.00 QI:0/-1/0/0/-1/1/1/0/108
MNESEKNTAAHNITFHEGLGKRGWDHSNTSEFFREVQSSTLDSCLMTFSRSLILAISRGSLDFVNIFGPTLFYSVTTSKEMRSTGAFDGCLAVLFIISGLLLGPFPLN